MKKWIIIIGDNAYIYEGAPKNDNSNFIEGKKEEDLKEEDTKNNIVMDIEVFKALF